MTCSNPDDARTIVEAIVNEFITEPHQRSDQERAQEHSSMLNNRLAQLQADLGNVNDAIEQKIALLRTDRTPTFSSTIRFTREFNNLETKKLETNTDYEKAKTQLKNLQRTTTTTAATTPS